nr:hypothetical protein [Tanacetum cinerariifolium]
QVQDEVAYEIPPTGNASATGVALKTGLEKEVATIGPPVNKRRRKRSNNEAEANAPPKVLRRDYDAFRPAQSTHGGKSLASMGLDAGPLLSTPAAQDPSTATKSVSDPEQLSYANPPLHHEKDIAQERLPRSSPKMLPSRRLISSSPWGVLNQEGLPLSPPWSGRQTISINRDFLDQYNITMAQKIAMGSQLRLRFEQETKNLKTLLEAEVDMKKSAEAKNAELAKELDSLRAQFSNLQVSNKRLSDHVLNLQAQVTGEEKINAAFEEFKKYEDDKVKQRCAEMDARLDKLSVNFDEELYPHMLTAIAGRRWVIGHGLRLAVMKHAESSEIRQAFTDVVSAGLAKGMSEGLKYGIEHNKAGRDLVNFEAYDPESNNKLVKALQDLKDLKYPMIDQLKKLKDAPMDLIMASLYLESDTEKDAPQWIRDLRASSSQLKIPVYPEVRDPEDLWAIKEEMLLEDAIAAKISRTEKKKKCRVVCRTHGISFAHHARSDGIPVFAPTVP